MIIYLILYIASFILSRLELYYFSGAALLIAALCLYLEDYLKYRNPIHLRAVFSTFWVGGQGIACLKLSKLQSDWCFMTWLCFFTALMGFWWTFELKERRRIKRQIQEPSFSISDTTVFRSIIFVTILSAAAFSFEAVKLQMIPFLIRGVPHAYSVFHISGVHYFTVSCVLVPSLAVIYFMTGYHKPAKNIIVCILTAIALAIPILCVSRFQLIFAVMLAIFTYIASKRQINLLAVIIPVLLLVPCYVILTIARSHDVEYLNSIFEMKNSSIPIFITQPYIYIANNYENFNCLAEVLPKHTFGLRMLFPVWALTGLKFLIPSLVDFPIYVNKEELTTVTLFYDAYYDFGIVGVLLFSSFFGFVSQWITSKLERVRNPILYLFYAQLTAYGMLSFFTTWFSNPATWFYFVLTGLLGLYINNGIKN